jgi:hypothetical protein
MWRRWWRGAAATSTGGGKVAPGDFIRAEKRRGG